MIGADTLDGEATPRRILRQAQDEEYVSNLNEKILILSLSKDAPLGHPAENRPVPNKLELLTVALLRRGRLGAAAAGLVGPLGPGGRGRCGGRRGGELQDFFVVGARYRVDHRRADQWRAHGRVEGRGTAMAITREARRTPAIDPEIGH